MASRRLAVSLLSLVWLGCAPKPQSLSPQSCPALQSSPSSTLDLTIYDTAATSPAPRRLRSEPARYPGALVAAGRGGEATAVLVVDKSGHPEPESIRVTSASDPLLVAPTTEIAAHTVYCPGARDGHPVRTRVTLHVRYTVLVSGDISQEISP